MSFRERTTVRPNREAEGRQAASALVSTLASALVTVTALVQMLVCLDGVQMPATDFPCIHTRLIGILTLKCESRAIGNPKLIFDPSPSR